jgi:hypothetical protein
MITRGWARSPVTYLQKHESKSDYAEGRKCWKAQEEELIRHSHRIPCGFSSSGCSRSSGDGERGTVQPARGRSSYVGLMDAWLEVKESESGKTRLREVVLPSSQSVSAYVIWSTLSRYRRRYGPRSTSFRSKESKSLVFF